MTDQDLPPEYRSSQSLPDRLRAAMRPGKAWFALILFALALGLGCAIGALWMHARPVQPASVLAGSTATPDPTHPPLPAPMTGGLSTLPPPATPTADAPHIAASPADETAASGLANDASSSASLEQDAAASAAAASTDDNSEAQVIERKQPEYPSDALQAHQEGDVRLQIAIDATGNVEDVRIAHSSGSASLDRAAMDAARGWRYRPARHDGEAVSGVVEVPVQFSLDER
jgi:TonB family protein